MLNINYICSAGVYTPILYKNFSLKFVTSQCSEISWHNYLVISTIADFHEGYTPVDEREWSAVTGFAL